MNIQPIHCIQYIDRYIDIGAGPSSRKAGTYVL